MFVTSAYQASQWQEAISSRSTFEEIVATEMGESRRPDRRIEELAAIEGHQRRRILHEIIFILKARAAAAFHALAPHNVTVQLLPGPAWDAATRKIAPHVVLDAPPDCELMQREIFGPILPLRGYRQLGEVVDACLAYVDNPDIGLDELLDIERRTVER